MKSCYKYSNEKFIKEYEMVSEDLIQRQFLLEEGGVYGKGVERNFI